MKLHRFITDLNLNQDIVSSKDNELINQIRNVLRLKPNHLVILIDKNGHELKASIKSFSKNEINFNILEKLASHQEPDKYIKLYCSILKRANFELVVQKATELGVKEIIPVRTAHTIKQNIKIDRLNKIAREATEQSGRTTIPTIKEPISFVKALEDSKANEVNFIFHTNIKEKFFTGKKVIGIFIGPEGGWTNQEIEEAKQNKIKPASLGRLTLRAETASIVATFLALQ